MNFDYPYTDMHELNLDWFLAEFKKYYEKTIEQNEKIQSLDETVTQFTDFVTNYFDNLDVQQEINNKLDAMLSDGTLKALIEPYYDEMVAAITGRQDVLEARIDNLAHLTEGSTTGDAELMDIRVSYNGVTYTSAGDAVRGSDSMISKALSKNISEIYNVEDRITVPGSNVTNFYYLDASGLAVNGAGYKLHKYQVTAGDIIYIKNPAATAGVYQFQSSSSVPSSGTNNNLVGTTVTTAADNFVIVPTGATWLILSMVSSDSTSGLYNIEPKFKYAPDLKNLMGSNTFIYYPVSLSSGDKLTLSTADGTTEAVNLLVFDEDKNQVEYWSMSSYTKRTITLTHDAYYLKWDRAISVPMMVELGEAATPYVPYALNINNDVVIEKAINALQLESDPVKNIKNAQHRIDGTGNSLTLLHFSDLHQDTGALARIMNFAAENSSLIDDIICTGDMVANTGASISGWWDGKAMTCIGNHDSATFSGGVYNWNGISMADRDAYYIAPFESDWSITHTSGTSYYYKDYAAQSVRLIVIDAMMYLNNAMPTESTAQTAWFTNLLSDAISNNLHVLVATHAPHGVSDLIECSFNKNNTTSINASGSCNTPDDIVNAVATAISGGLDFIGYICGHTHQDYIVDVSGDGSQLMYCVTCANVSQSAQWDDGDQYRSDTMDAFNIVNIDTVNKKVRLVRCGGADVDCDMRTRKGITFDYSTGQIIGQIL